jgi:hypothetical protein
MTESKLKEIKEILCRKSKNKQQVFKLTQAVFHDLKMVLRDIESEITPEIGNKAPLVEVKYYDKGDFEAHLKFSGDTLVIMMHTNVFDLEENHYITKTKYIQEDPLREFCGMIQVYNFLSDSLRYNREHDMGYLIARIFINKDQHFFIDGKRPLPFMFGDLEKNIMSKENLRTIVEEAMLFCLNFDLVVPPVDAINFITVEQKNIMSYSSGMPTSKRLGFIMQKDDSSLS